MEAIKIYKNYGCLGAEKRAIYTYGNPQPTATCSDEITVRTPEGWETYESISGETILTAPWGDNYTMHQILSGDEHPCFRTFGHGDKIELEVLEGEGDQIHRRKSRRFLRFPPHNQELGFQEIDIWFRCLTFVS